HAFSWTPDGGMIELPVDWSEAVAVNDSGQVVGHFFLAGRRHAFSWTPDGGMVELRSLGDIETQVKAVNANGQVVGWSSSDGGDFAIFRAVLWQPIANLGCNATLAGCNLKGANLAGAYLKD